MIYATDNYGQWRSDQSALIEAFSQDDCPSRETVKRIAPRDTDYFVVKPQVSAFYASSLPVLLPRLGVSRLVLTGVAADICVLFTAADAHKREYDLWVPSDAVASEADDRKAWALDIRRKSMGAETRSTDDLSLQAWIEKQAHPTEARWPRGRSSGEAWKLSGGYRGRPPCRGCPSR